LSFQVRHLPKVPTRPMIKAIVPKLDRAIRIRIQMPLMTPPVVQRMNRVRVDIRVMVGAGLLLIRVMAFPMDLEGNRQTALCGVS